MKNQSNLLGRSDFYRPEATGPVLMTVKDMAWFIWWQININRG